MLQFMKHRAEGSSVRRLVRSIDKIVEFFPKLVACVSGKAFFTIFLLLSLLPIASSRRDLEVLELLLRISTCTAQVILAAVA